MSVVQYVFYIYREYDAYRISGVGGGDANLGIESRKEVEVRD